LQIILNRARHAIPHTASGRWASHLQAQYRVSVFVELSLVNAYRRRKLEGARVVASPWMAANGVAIECDGAIAEFPIA
jgi:hypothetical protein